MGNTHLLGKKVGRPELKLLIPTIDISKKGGAFQTEIRKVQTIANVEIVGRKYIVHELYETPKEIIHGNAGKTPWNKGKVDESSYHYKLAKLLIEVKSDDFFTRTAYMKLLGLQTENMEHFNKYFKNKKYSELDTMDKFTFDEFNGLSTSLHRQMKNAFKLIENGHFPAVTIEEELWYVTFKGKYAEAKELEMMDDLYALYKKADSIAKAFVKENYGTKLIFPVRTKYENEKYEEIICNDNEFKLLEVYDIHHFYSKYKVVNNGQPTMKTFDLNYEEEDYDGSEHETEWLTDEDHAWNYVESFVNHRKENAEKNIGNVIATATEEYFNNFNNKQLMMDFSAELYDLFFQNFDYDTFKRLHTKHMEDVKKVYNTALDETVENNLPDNF